MMNESDAPFAPVAYIQDVDGGKPKADLQRLLDLLGGLEEYVDRGDRVFIKPNFVAPFQSAVTDYTLLSAVISMVRDLGGRPLVGDSSGFEFDTASTFKALGLDSWAADQDVRVVNLDEEEFIETRVDDDRFRSLMITKLALDTDTLINMPRLKKHSLTRVTLGMKNLMGLLGHDSRRLVHAKSIEAGIIALNRVVQPDLTIIDGLTTLSRAVYGSSEPAGVLVGGSDLRSLDPFCAGLLGVSFRSVPHIAGFAGSNPEFRVVGDTPPDLEYSSDSDGPAQELYRLVFKGIYLADQAYSTLRQGHSLVPAVHYWLGIRPVIRARDCTRCGECLHVCPVDAIELRGPSIIASVCMKLRCLRCVEACPEEAIEVRGWRTPG